MSTSVDQFRFWESTSSNWTIWKVKREKLVVFAASLACFDARSKSPSVTLRH